MAQGVFLRLLAGVAAALACGSAAALEGFPAGLKAATVLVVDDESGEVLYGKNALTSVPIASISKLMTAIVTLDAALPPDEPITIGQDEIRATWPNTRGLKRAPLLPATSCCTSRCSHQTIGPRSPLAGLIREASHRSSKR